MKEISLQEKIRRSSARVGIIGLGYVGLPLAVLCAQRGMTVTGLVRSQEKVQKLLLNQSDIDTIFPSTLENVIKSGKFTPALLSSTELAKQDIIIICVPTPVLQNKTPDLSAMQSVARVLSAIDLTDKLIINESTVAPGTTRTLLADLGTNHLLACSPERVDPGNKKHHIASIPKVVGGIEAKSLECAVLFYKQILNADVVSVSSLEAAEMAKMLENTYRAVNIALVNEIALLCESIGIDVLEVIQAASTKWSFHPHYPGIGVGGHCIPVDPYYLLELAHLRKSPMTVVPAALSRNNMMSQHVFRHILRSYKKGMTILIYGLTYKRDVADLRESPSLELCHLLKTKKIPFRVYDPFVSENTIRSLGFIIGKRTPVDIVVIVTDHTSLAADAKRCITNSTIVIDGRNYFQKKVGKIVIGIGRRFA